jgi:hypothetical protein
MKTTTKTSIMTREQYMNNECTHSEYYSQFVTAWLKKGILNALGREKLVKHFKANDMFHKDHIELKKWDKLTGMAGANFKAYGDTDSLAGRVCVLKAAARQAIAI